MIPIQQSIKLSPYMGLYDLTVPKENMLRRINDLVDFTFVYEELKIVYSQKLIEVIEKENASSNTQL